MKQIFDLLREQIETECEKLHLKEPNGNEFDAIEVDEVLKLINEAEAKWEADCCEWKFFKPSNSLYEKHGDFRTDDELAKWNVCPYCGKPIKISEVE